tara:strand:+ start:916 stop:1143 length:228 start_codon:yes stop_codon:yes gene_type:complete
MGESLHKAFLGVIALRVSCIAIELVPVSRQAAYWNRCLDNTIQWINEASFFNGWSKKLRIRLLWGYVTELCMRKN